MRGGLMKQVLMNPPVSSHVMNAGKNAFFALMVASTAIFLAPKAFPQSQETASGSRNGLELKGEDSICATKFLNSANAWAKEEKWENAKVQWRRAADCGDDGALLTLGRRQLQDLEYSAAIKTLKEYTEKCPDERAGWIALLGAYVEIGDKQGTQECLSKLAKINGPALNPMDLATIMDAYALLGNKLGVRKIVKKIIKSQKRNPDEIIGLVGRMNNALAMVGFEGLPFETVEAILDARQ
jgi:tetratricopeptide (TPR) repeat protein